VRLWCSQARRGCRAVTAGVVLDSRPLRRRSDRGVAFISRSEERRRRTTVVVGLNPARSASATHTRKDANEDVEPATCSPVGETRFQVQWPVVSSQTKCHTSMLKASNGVASTLDHRAARCVPKFAVFCARSTGFTELTRNRLTERGQASANESPAISALCGLSASLAREPESCGTG
jgi:hypothetical protein